MASPDFSQYIDLTIFDPQPETLYENALEYARIALPEWTPVRGSVEDAILQACAQMSGELAGAINRLPNGIMEALLQIFGITRNTGVPPTVDVTINVIDAGGYTVPAGTRFGFLDDSDPLNPVLYTFDTDEDLTIGVGSTSGTVSITGTAAIEYPTLASGETIQVLSALSFIESATLNSDLSIGENPETDAVYFERAVAKLNSYTSALVLPHQIEQYILTTYTDVYRCNVYNLTNGANDGTLVPDAPGYITIYGCGKNGASVTPTAASAIVEDVADRTVAGLNIAFKAPLIVPVQVDVTVTLAQGYAQTTTYNNVVTALNQLLHPDYFPWNDWIYYNEIISYIDRVPGVARVKSMTITIDPLYVTVEGDDFMFDRRGCLPLVTPVVTVEAVTVSGAQAAGFGG